MHALWTDDSPAAWAQALATYDAEIARQGVGKLPELDAWYHDALPRAITSRASPHVTHDELVRLTEWKMARGVWRARNLVLVKGNAPETVVASSTEALAMVPHPSKPIAILASLDGVGPATASAVAAAYAPEVYPFFDEIVAKQIPSLGAVKFTPGYYAKYADAIRDRAAALGTGWTPAKVERALFAFVGGKSPGRV